MACRRFSVVCKELGARSILFKKTSSLSKWTSEVSGKNVCDWGSIVTKWLAHRSNSRVKTILEQFNERLNVLAVLFAKQCNGLAAQRLRRTMQIGDLYSDLYGGSRLHQFIRKLCSQLMRDRSGKGRRRLAVFGAALFSWDQNAISDDEIHRFSEEIETKSRDDTNDRSTKRPVPHIGKDWERVIDRDKLVVWQRPVPGSYIYEYKVYGTFYDIPARAFFDIQVDLEYRKQWDHLILQVDVVDEDQETESEVVRWLQHFPYPMYSREYVFVRRVIVDKENQRLVLMSRGVDHPKCPQNSKYVRVKNYKSNLILKPHTTIDENGFDYVLTYSDDPQAAIPSVAYSWMASTGVPDYCEKMHNVAKQFHEKSKGAEESERGPETTYDQLSAAINNSKKRIAA